ncbi:hypothetical protein [Stagnihabitans tardus]|uniref:Transferrin-binding protein B C-lobe/N-lobe beta barrel domain-containing protein n=1 Tax=Stagnihabitans tardus TaxID=2699202 RepID=A0AAE4YEL0_9RHOB|nr:hypothetical protein [Stagnihabitans tardus]NBZ88709.1 hypothetical protein [Stagnihabitans tardus]
MQALRLSVLALALLTGCDGNPFAAGAGGGSAAGSVASLPGTTAPRASGAIVRREAEGQGTTDEVTGNGFAFQDNQINYDAANDTFAVDNLAFDGDNVYARTTAADGALPTEVRAYAASSTYADAQTGALIDQFSYRALYGVSTTGRSQFAIVRTGAYIPYGFGGFIYSRTSGVTLPGSGQANYTGTYTALRDAEGIPADGEKLTYVVGDMTMAIDFDDFNANASGVNKAGGVTGYVENRRIFDLAGNDITQSIVDQINDDNNLTTNAIAELPILNFSVGPGVIDANGEIEGDLTSTIPKQGGGAQGFEEGKYYAVVSGDDADEVVGVIVVTSQIDSVTLRETGGFILYRQ